MAVLNLIITTAGQTALANAGTLGPVVLSKVAIGSGTWSTAPTAAATALKTQIKQLTPSGSSTPSAGVIHITATDDSTDAYSVYEIGLYTSTNVLFAIAGGTSVFISKASGSSSLFAVDLNITNVPSGSLTIGTTGFSYPAATETVQGVAEIATTAEVTAGTDDTRIVTPLKLAGEFAGRIASSTEVTVGTNDTKIVTPLKLNDVLYSRNKFFNFNFPTATVVGNYTWSNIVLWSDPSVCGYKQVVFKLRSFIDINCINGDNSGGMYFKIELIAKSDSENTEYILASFAATGTRPFNPIRFLHQDIITPSNVDLTSKKLKLRISARSDWTGDYFAIQPSGGYISYEGITKSGTAVTTSHTARSQTANGDSGSYTEVYTGGGMKFMYVLNYTTFYQPYPFFTA